VASTNETARVYGGKQGIIFAADIKAVSAEGHTTVYPSNDPTIALQIPTAGGVIPSHKVLYSGPCKDTELRFGTN
jgi:hypothetical protein